VSNSWRRQCPGTPTPQYQERTVLVRCSDFGSVAFVVGCDVPVGFLGRHRRLHCGSRLAGRWLRVSRGSCWVGRTWSCCAGRSSCRRLRTVRRPVTYTAGNLTHTDALVVLTNAHSSNTCFLGPTRVHIQKGIVIGSAVFLHSTRQRIPILYNGPPLLVPLKISVSTEGHLDPYLSYGSLGPPESKLQTACRLVPPFVQGSQS